MLLVLTSGRPRESDVLLHSIISDMLNSLERFGTQSFKQNEDQQRQNYRDFGILAALGRKMEITAGESARSRGNIRMIASKLLKFSGCDRNLMRQASSQEFNHEVNFLALELVGLVDEIGLHRKYRKPLRDRVTKIGVKISATAADDAGNIRAPDDRAAQPVQA